MPARDDRVGDAGLLTRGPAISRPQHIRSTIARPEGVRRRARRGTGDLRAISSTAAAGRA